MVKVYQAPHPQKNQEPKALASILLELIYGVVKATGFPSSHIWMWELDYKESWAQKNWCF